MKRVLLLVLAGLVVLCLFAGCSAKQNTGYQYYEEAAEAPAAEEYSDTHATQAPVYDDSEKGDEGAGTSTYYDSTLLQPSANRKIVFYGNIEARTNNYEQDMETISAKLQEYGGYQQDVSESGTPPEDWQDYGRSAHMTLRVPSKHFNAFMGVLKGLGETVSSSVRGEDVSVHYFDTETRLETLRIRETRLQDLLKEAAGLEDIIELERELANVSYEIQSLTSTLRDYDSLIDYSTVTINLHEVNVIDAVKPSEKSLGDRISVAFYSVLNALAVFGEGLLIFFIGGSPILIPLAIIAVIVIVLVRRYNKKKAAQNNTPPTA